MITGALFNPECVVSEWEGRLFQQRPPQPSLAIVGGDSGEFDSPYISQSTPPPDSFTVGRQRDFEAIVNGQLFARRL